MDNNECGKCRDVDHLRDAWRGSRRGYGDNVGVLSSEFNQWSQGMAEAQQIGTT